MWKHNSKISIEEFIQGLTTGGGILPSPVDCVEYGYRSGWLEAQDVAGRKESLRRKTAARILHEFLRRERKEPEETDGSPAYCLQDLFDCRICAGHIIQIYVKGLMEDRRSPDGRIVFDTEGTVFTEEAGEILERVFYPEKRRVKHRVTSENGPEAKRISEEEAVMVFEGSRQALLIDVRTTREFDKEHMEGAVSFPLLDIIKNPYAVCESRDKMILLYCGESYQSEAAAKCLMEAGYGNVAYFAWNLTNKESNGALA